ncbi:MAG: hypothetical protein U9Q19_10425 [Pseudomonadota bacterium]|nr:hypothetical protein [Pseudomonadota bacterium]
MPDGVLIWRALRNPAKKDRLQWKNHMYQAGATTAKGLAAEEWKSLNTQWPGVSAKKKKKSAFKPKEKDWLVLDTRKKKTPQAHFVASHMLGETGTLYLRVKQQWLCLLVRANVPGQKLGRKPAHLGWVEGDDGDLLLTSRSATNPNDARAMLRGEIPVSYKYISGTQADEAEEVTDLWQVRSKGVPLYVNVDAERAELEDKLQVALKIIVRDAKRGRYATKNKLVNEATNLLFGEGAAPGPVTGSSAIEATNNLIGSWTGSEDLISPAMQGVHESIGIGVKLVFDLYRLHKLNNDDTGDHRERKMLYHDIATNVAKGAPSITAVVDTIGKMANAGQQIAGIAATANVAMPLVGAVIGFEEAARNFRKSDRAFQRLVTIKTSAGWLSEDPDEEVAMDSELGLLTQYAIGKLSRKSNRTGAVGMVGVVSF